MGVLRHVLSPSKASGVRPPAEEWVVSALDSAEISDLVGPLLRDCRGVCESGPRFSLAGIAADLAGRPGRTGRGFVAESRAVGPEPRPGTRCLGLAVVIEARGGGGRRFSIATLLVHPDVRRRGIAAALVAHALAHVRSTGGAEVWAETLSTWPAAAFWRRVAEHA